MKTKTVYLLHYQTPIVQKNGHCVQHYLGSAIELRKRMNQHWTGHGTSLTNAFFHRGIPFILAREWIGDRQLERKLKNRKKARLLCPICKEAH